MTTSSIYASSTGQNDEHERLRLHAEGIRERAAKAVPWGPETVGLPPQISESALLRINDVAFYANARQESIAFADLCLRLLALHHPRDAGGLTSGAAPPIQRCNCCMLRWPCPTIREMTGTLS
ncbi:hypothetical protein F4561_004290 [Lipingzhangella halophila]|uniref:Uncharacterized protein n=1 Tax=Lipingzhangella halophila TaxID=1783352 RepID=A0A7W7RK75_9ACTN|nr:hypothetical protein [Lipingzhangella halophila]MBB4933470.1 hypothetical protein [Lipingzhangella halophila]